MKKMFILQVLLSIGILIFISCSKEEPITPTPNINKIDYAYDYEYVDDEDDGSLVANGEIIIPPDTIKENTPRAKIIRYGDYIWQKITRTKYVHFKDRVIDGTNNIYKYDCSGFLHAIILQNALPGHAADLSARKQNIHPKDSGVRAWTFYDYFRDSILKNPDSISMQNQYWKVFTSIDSLKKGDLIIVRYDDDWREEWIKKGNPASTGHVMIAWEIGTVNSNNEVEIRVYDCSSSGHTKSADTRYCNSKPVAEINEDSKKQSGIGFGSMVYKISGNRQRIPYAYKWSLNSTHWYNLRSGDDIDEPDIKYNRLKGIIFARAI